MQSRDQRVRKAKLWFMHVNYQLQLTKLKPRDKQQLDLFCYFHKVKKYIVHTNAQFAFTFLTFPEDELY